MLKKIMNQIKQLKQLSRGSSQQRHGHSRRGSSSSNRRYKQSPMSGSNHYKRKGRSSS